MFLELIMAECNRGPALTNPDTATSESEDQPPCKVPSLFAAYSKARQKLPREKMLLSGDYLKVTSIQLFIPIRIIPTL